MTKSLFAPMAMIALMSQAHFLSAATRVDIVFDDSGSMSSVSRRTGQTFCEEAKKAVAGLLMQIRDANDVIEVYDLTIQPLNGQAMYVESFKDSSQVDRALSNLKLLECNGGTPLARVLGTMWSKNNRAGRQAPAKWNANSDLRNTRVPTDLILFVFSDGQNEEGEENLAHSLEMSRSTRFLDGPDWKSVYIKFFQVGSDKIVDFLNQRIKSDNFGNVFSAQALTDMAQLKDSMSEVMAQVINKGLLIQLASSTRNLHAAESLQTQAEDILLRAASTDAAPHREEAHSLISSLEHLKLEFDKLEHQHDAQLASAQFLTLLERLRALTTNGAPVVGHLNAFVYTYKNLLKDFSRVNLQIQEAEELAVKTLAYITKLESGQPSEFAKLTPEQLTKVSDLKLSLDKVIARSNNLRSRASILESQMVDAQTGLSDIVGVYLRLRQNISMVIANMSKKNGQKYEDLVRLHLADKGYTILKNGEIVYYGTHIFVGGGNGGGSGGGNGGGSGGGNSANKNNALGGDEITVRNKGTLIFLDSPSDRAGGGGGSGKVTFINEGTIINGVSRNIATGEISVFLSNGQVIHISKDESTLQPGAGYAWVKRENGYLIFSADFSDVYFITNELIALIRENHSVGSRLIGVVKLLGSGVVGAFAIGGSIILDAVGSVRESVFNNGNVGFVLVSRNAAITKELLKSSWIQVWHHKNVVSLPKAIIPTVLKIVEKN